MAELGKLVVVLVMYAGVGLLLYRDVSGVLDGWSW